MGKGASAEKVVREIQRRTRRRFSAEEKIRIVLEGLRGEESIATLCRREGLSPNLYYRCTSSDESGSMGSISKRHSQHVYPSTPRGDSPACDAPLFAV